MKNLVNNIPLSVPCPLDFDPVVEEIRRRAYERGARTERARIVACLREAARTAICSGCRVQGETLAHFADSLDDVGRIHHLTVEA